MVCWVLEEALESRRVVVSERREEYVEKRLELRLEETC